MFVCMQDESILALGKQPICEFYISLFSVQIKYC